MILSREIVKREYEYKGAHIMIKTDATYERWRISAIIESTIGEASRHLYCELDKQLHPTEDAAIGHTMTQIKHQIDRATSSTE